jgi:hypothetical protein
VVLSVYVWWQGLLDRHVPASNITVALNGHAATKT